MYYLAVPSTSCSMRNLIPWPAIKPWPPAFLSYWTTREVLVPFLLKIPSLCLFVVNNASRPLTTTALFSFPIIGPFAECDINGIIYSLLCWASSIQYSASGSFPGGKLVKNPPANVSDLGSIPGLGRSPGGGHSNPFQYSCLENPMDRGAWRAKIQSVTKSWIWLKQLGKPACILRLRFL